MFCYHCNKQIGDSLSEIKGKTYQVDKDKTFYFCNSCLGQLLAYLSNIIKGGK